MPPPIDPDTLRRINELEINLQKARLEVDTQKRELDRSVAALKEKDAKLVAMEAEVAKLAQKSLDLTRTIEVLTQARPRIKIDELAKNLQSALESINEEARKKSAAGKLSTMIENFEVEVKGGLDLKNGIHLTQPQEVSAQTVSTLRFALRPVVSVRIAEDKEGGQG